jgi:tetratricopeptide (TPR) repeat protein
MKQKALFLLVSLTLLRVTAPAQTWTETRAFADSLFTAGKLDAALPVYQRTAFFMRPVIDAEILCRIADCFFSVGDLEFALEFYDHSYFAQNNDSIKKEVLFRKTACYLRSHNYNFALMELLSLEDNLSPGFEKKRNFYLGMTWFGLEDFSKAGGFFEKAAETPDDQLLIRKIFENTRQFNKPNPKLASWLSIFLPGAGQIYAGETLAGINSLLLTGFFVGVGFYIISISSPIDALFTALPWFQRYYQGGFQRAAEMAKHKRTENRNQIFNQVIELIAHE